MNFCRLIQSIELNILSCNILVSIAITILITHVFNCFDCVILKWGHCVRQMVSFARIQIVALTFFKLLFWVDNLLTIVCYCYTQLSLGFILLRYSISMFLLLMTYWKGSWYLARHHLLWIFSSVLKIWEVLKSVLCAHYVLVPFQNIFY